jgi:hypothetical protein
MMGLSCVVMPALQQQHPATRAPQTHRQHPLAEAAGLAHLAVSLAARRLKHRLEAAAELLAAPSHTTDCDLILPRTSWAP